MVSRVRALSKAPAGTLGRVGRQLGGAGQEGGGGREPTARLGPAGRPLQLGRNRLVGPRCSACAVPGPPIRVLGGVGGLGEGAMDPVAVVDRGRMVGGRADEWMGELHAPVHLEEPGLRRGDGRGHVDAKVLGGAAEQDRVAEGLGGRGQDQQPGVGGQQLETPAVALFDLAGHRLAAGKPESAGELGGPPGTRQLEQREGVAVALGDELVTDGSIQGAVHILEQQRAGIAVAESMDRQRGQPGEDVVAAAGAGRAHQRDPLGQKTPGDEPQDLRGSLVEPLRVVHKADQWVLLGGLGHEGQGGQPHHEPVGGVAGTQPEHRRQGVPLGDGEPVEVVQQGRAQLVETAVGQLHLRLHANGPGDLPAGDPVGQVAQQGALAHPRLPAQDGDAALPGEDVGHELVERCTLGTASEELGWLTAILARG
jgi:hypothetical protein